MIEFFLLLNFSLEVVNLCLLISILKTNDNVLDLALDNNRYLRRLEKFIRRKK